MTAHDPHKTASSAGRRVHSPAGDRIVATPSAMQMSPAVSRARCLYGHSRHLGQHQQGPIASAEHPLDPAVLGCW